jgi:uncharacterized membrane-anchored protein YitT (DUF2179 family)
MKLCQFSGLICVPETAGGNPDGDRMSTIAARVGLEKHRLYEDALALLFGCLMVSLGAVIYVKATLLTGSIAGLSLLFSYVTGLGFGLIFFVLNLPFYILAVLRMGWLPAIRTFIAVSLVSLFSKLATGWIGFSMLDPLYATVMGGILMGTGLLMLFRHRTGLGGINILAIYLQESFGIRAGYFQLAVDAAILASAYFVVPADRLALSFLGIAILNLIIAINHKPGRYTASS